MTDAAHPRVLRSLPDDEREEFIEWLHESREDDVRRASRAAMKRYVRSATVGFVLLVIGLAVAFMVARNDNNEARQEAVAQVQKASDKAFKSVVQSGNAVAVAGCNRDYLDRVQFRKLIIRAKGTLAANLQRGDITQRQYDEAIDFYDDTLRENVLPNCKLAAKTVTADPNRRIIPPKPLYRGYRNDKNRG